MNSRTFGANFLIIMVFVYNLSWYTMSATHLNVRGLVHTSFTQLKSHRITWQWKSHCFQWCLFISMQFWKRALCFFGAIPAQFWLHRICKPHPSSIQVASHNDTESQIKIWSPQCTPSLKGTGSQTLNFSVGDHCHLFVILTTQVFFH